MSILPLFEKNLIDKETVKVCFFDFQKINGLLTVVTILSTLNFLTV
ncbi:hypothetical protein [Xenorhabdus doucetiae]|uniref:Uncharacterized protein n=1 Tax=Xenorhabdus doucetiae TaxID=351671 RepID=A0A068QRC9_9GAMM|nr:hypothetical protein [Xenorhabdus doucetiae]CDG17186.1 protein of unknown function [Xenorhabdus doucetiae]